MSPSSFIGRKSAIFHSEKIMHVWNHNNNVIDKQNVVAMLKINIEAKTSTCSPNFWSFPSYYHRQVAAGLNLIGEL